MNTHQNEVKPLANRMGNEYLVYRYFFILEIGSASTRNANLSPIFSTGVGLFPSINDSERISLFKQQVPQRPWTT